MTRFALSIVTAFIFLSHLQGQVGIRLVCSPRPDSILLRWAPTDRAAWQLGNRYGYIVERYTLLKKGKLLEDNPKVLLTPEPFKPRPIEAWEQYEADKYVSIAAECIFGKDSTGTGGNPYLVAQRYQLEQNRFSFALYAADQSVTTARLSGLYLADLTAAKDEKYLYKVYIPVPDSALAVDTASAFTGISEYQPLPQPLDLKAQWVDKKVELSWDILYLQHIYNSYVIEKSEDGVHFTALNDNASIQLADAGVTPYRAYKSDSLAQNRSTYFYCVRGKSAFGELGPRSKVVSGRARVPITQAPVITEKEVINNRKVRLTWTYPDNMNEYITGFSVYRSAAPNGPKEKQYECRIPSIRTYTDENPGLTNYYIMSVFNDENEIFSSIVSYAELIDSIPPVAPSGMVGNIDSTGIVRLHWKCNPDKDISAYRVYRANRPDFEYILISSSEVKDTTFVDSVNLKTLTRDVHYKFRAIDQRQNQSPLSEVLTLSRPDIIPPVAPVMLDIKEQKGTLSITWVNSTSTDIARHHIYRKGMNDSTFILLASQAKSQEAHSTYIDKSAKPGGTYSYYVMAEDLSGLRSDPSGPTQMKVPSGIVENVRLTNIQHEGSVELKWNIQSEKEVARVLVYRSVENAPLKLYGNSSGPSYTDDRLLPEKSYTYRVKAVYQDESTSPLSNAVTIKN